MAMLLVKVAVNAAISYGLGLLARSIAGTETIKQEGSRLSEVQITSSTEGSTIKRLWGTSRVGGQIIWATKFKEVKKTDSEEVGGKGGGGQEVETTTYTYYCSFAVSLIESSNKTQLGRIWVDGKVLDQTKHTIRFYNGSQTQEPDSFIESKEGVGRVPAFRGVAYLVFEEMDLTEYGNRIPQISVEITKPIEGAEGDASLEALAKGWCLIPSAGEFVYGTTVYTKEDGKGNAETINVHNEQNKPNIVASLDQLEALAPETHTVMLVVSWFGSDLRIGSCTLHPKVEVGGDKFTYPHSWCVSNVTRGTAQVVTQVDGGPAYGGTPADVTVRQAIQNIKSRGWRAVFYPFIMMDIPEGNTLPRPEGGTGQPIYPWRGRIRPTDAQQETSAVTTAVANFVGTADAGDYGDWNGSQVVYTGPTEWTYRRMIFHYVALLKDLLGPNDAFIIGSEMVGATTARSNTAGSFPFVDALVSIASEVKAELGSTKVSYAADWTEYNNYRPDDGSGDVYFHLDPLWASSSIDFVGIDAYFPLSDWQDGTAHLDYDQAAGITSIYASNYLESSIEGGELYDWYYASPEDRADQVRTPIVDGAEGKHWVFRQKDFRNWWQNRHYNRPDGVEAPTPTGWTQRMKPIWFTEFGCSSVDKGANQPNVFVDPKSSESYLPYFSNGTRDDFMQRRYNQAMLHYWSINGGGEGEGFLENMLLWCWDARPYPEFPFRDDVWTDGANWTLGHWMTGRLGAAPLADLVKEICGLVGVPGSDVDVLGLLASGAVVRGYLVEDIKAPREMLQDLSIGYNFDGYESTGRLTFNLRSNAATLTLDLDDLVTSSENPGGYSITRAQETDLPSVLKLSFIDEQNDYNVGGADARTSVGYSRAVHQVALPLVLPQAYVRALGDIIIQEAWLQRETASFLLPRSLVRLDPSDVIDVAIKGREMKFRVAEVDTGDSRQVEAYAYDPSTYSVLDYSGRSSKPRGSTVYGRSKVAFMDIPIASASEPRHHAPRIAAYQAPWPGAVNVFQEDGAGGWTLKNQARVPANMGELAFDLYGGPLYRWDTVNALYVDLYDPTASLFSKNELEVLNGANVLALQNQNGDWEIIQFQTATPVSEGRYQLSSLLRGQLGSEAAMLSPTSAGGQVVFLDSLTIVPLSLKEAEVGEAFDYRFGPGPLAVGDSRYTTQSKTFKGVGLRPYSPVSLAGTWDYASGDITLSWIRRTRLGGDNWNAADAPLNEEFERYEVDVMNGSTVLRTFVVNGATVRTYTAAQQTTDFGSLRTSLKFRVYQMSAVFGRGSRAEATVYA